MRATLFSALSTLLLSTASFAQVQTEKWNFDRELENQSPDKNEKVFPEYIVIESGAKKNVVKIKLPSQQHEKGYIYVMGQCRSNSSVQSYTENNEPYDLLETARVCQKKKQLDVQLRWEKRDSKGKWTLLATGTYMLLPQGEHLLFERTNTAPGAKKSVNARADYKK